MAMVGILSIQVQLLGLKWEFLFFFFFLRAGRRGAVTSALAITVQLEGVGTVSLVVLM